jgi:hypothetical protein
VRTFTITSVIPATPVLTTPANGIYINTATPALTWQAATNAKSYKVEWANNPSFTGAAFQTVTTTTYTLTAAQALQFGTTYYWHVIPLNAAGTPGTASGTFSFTPTLLKTPLDNAASTVNKPAFSWLAVTGGTYQIEIATDSNFSNIVAGTLTPSTALTYTPTTALPVGMYYWRVKLTVASVTTAMPAWKFSVNATIPVAPTTSSPVNNGIINDSTPTLIWNAVASGQTYQVQIDDLSTFASPNQDVVLPNGVLTYTANSLLDIKYYWRVRAININGAAGAWSAAANFTIDSVPPAAPTLAGPTDGTTTTTPQLTLRWNAVTGATSYELRLDTVNPPAAPAILLGNTTSYIPPTTLPYGVYYWQVRARDIAGNWGSWSDIRSFTLIAGLSSARVTATPTPTASVTATVTATPTSTPTVVPTVPTETPTTAPTASPVSNATQIVEAESEFVARIGNWTAQPTTNASGGAYLYSSGLVTDALTLQFTGTAVEVIYVSHSAFGTLAIEIDGNLAQTVITAGATTQFGIRTAITGLTAGSHTARIYAASGTIAVDAFLVEPQTLQAIVTPTSTPTVVPTATPTAEPVTVTPEPSATETITPAPTQAATDVPTATSTPEESATPTAIVPLTLPVIQTTGDAAMWAVNGDSTTGTLTLKTPVSLVSAINPALTFQSVFVAQTPVTQTGVAQVAVSIDGVNWQPVMAVNPSTTPTLITVDLTAYRGQNVWLRFEWNALAGVSWQVDNVTIAESVATAVPTPTDTPTLPPTEIPTEVLTATPTEIPVETAAPVPTDVPPTNQPVDPTQAETPTVMP